MPEGSEIESSPATRRTCWWCLAGVLVAATILTAWGLGATGLGNPYYTATSISGSESWTSMFYGSIDSEDFITTDKPPLAMAIDALSVRLFGLSSWSILLPQILAGAGSVVLLFDAVRRVWGSGAGLLAATAMAFTPIVVAVNRQNLPDPVLVLCLVGAAWALVRGLESGRVWWLLGSMALVGLGFNAKLLQAWIILPALGLSWLFFAPCAWWRRALHGLAALTVVLGVSFSWMLIVDARAEPSLPHIGGSEDGTVSDLVFGYNGLGRIFGGEGNPQSAMFDSGPGWGRMFNAENGDQISWLMPLAGICLVALVALGVRGRDRLALASCTLWGLWLITHMVVFSKAEGIYHTYYTYALSPAIGALVGAGVVALWSTRSERWARATLALGVGVTAWWSAALLARVPAWNPWLTPAVIALGAAAALGTLLLTPGAEIRLSAWPVGAGNIVLALIVVATMLAPSAYATSAITRDSGMSIASAGPKPPPVSRLVVDIVPPAQWNQGLLDYLQRHRDGERWAVAAQGSFVGAPMIIEMGGTPVMIIGGFVGFDPVPTLDELTGYIERGELRYVLIADNAKVAEIRARGMDKGPFGSSVEIRDDRASQSVVPAGPPAPPPAPPPEFAKAIKLGNERAAWVLAHCPRVDPPSYGGADLASMLFDCKHPRAPA